MAAQDASTFCAEFSYARRCGKFYTYIHLTGDKAGDPGRVFYVGKGQKTRAWMTNRTKYWKHVADKHGFSVQICAYWDSESDAFLHERLLISSFRDIGVALSNLTDGGEGSSGIVPSAEKRAKISKARMGQKQSDEVLAKISASLTGRIFSAEHREKIAKANRGKIRDPEIGKKISAAKKGKRQSPESVARRAATQKALYATPEYKKILSAASIGRSHTEEARAKIGDAHRGKVLSPETRKKISDARTGKALTPEHRLKISEGLRARRSANQPELNLDSHVD